MPLCNDLRQQKSNLQASLNAVNAAIGQTTSASQLQALRIQQANLRAQLSHVGTLINQNCAAGMAALMAPAVAKPALVAVRTKAHKDLLKAVKNFTTASIAHNQAVIKALGLPGPKKAAKKKAAKKQ